jgi:hypothetical protein
LKIIIHSVVDYHPTSARVACHDCFLLPRRQNRPQGRRPEVNATEARFVRGCDTADPRTGPELCLPTTDYRT